MSTDPVREPVEQFERLPLLTQRALILVAYAAIDSTEDEKRVVDAALGRMAAHETAPEKLRELTRLLRSLVGAVQSQADMNYLARQLQSESDDDEGKPGDEE